MGMGMRFPLLRALEQNGGTPHLAPAPPPPGPRAAATPPGGGPAPRG
ncbi:MAG: hypothetical protein ACI80N_001255, partial [Gammaproteobacteria bacterium]